MNLREKTVENILNEINAFDIKSKLNTLLLSLIHEEVSVDVFKENIFNYLVKLVDFDESLLSDLLLTANKVMRDIYYLKIITLNEVNLAVDSIYNESDIKKYITRYSDKQDIIITTSNLLINSVMVSKTIRTDILEAIGGFAGMNKPVNETNEFLSNDVKHFILKVLDWWYDNNKVIFLSELINKRKNAKGNSFLLNSLV